MKKLPLLLWLFLLSSLCFGEEYQLVLDRPEKVQQKKAVEMEVHEEQTMELFANDQPVKEKKESYDLKFSGTETVLATDKDQNAIKVSIVVNHFVRTTGTTEDTLLQKGDEIVAWSEQGRKVIHVNGIPAAESLKKLVDKVVSVKREGSPSDDMIFGTTKKITVGDMWPINSVAAASDFAELSSGITDKDVTGNATLKRVVKDPNGDLLEVAATVLIVRLKPLGPEFQKQDGKMKGTLTGLFPVDTTKQKTFEQLNFEMDLQAFGMEQREGQAVRLQMKMHASTSKTTRWKPLR